MDIDIYETRDMSEATLLFAIRFPFEGMRRVGSVCYFKFRNKKRADEVIESFWRGDLKVNLRDFVDCQYRIKTLIFKEYEYGNQKHKSRTTHF